MHFHFVSVNGRIRNVRRFVCIHHLLINSMDLFPTYTRKALSMQCYAHVGVRQNLIN